MRDPYYKLLLAPYADQHRDLALDTTTEDLTSVFEEYGHVIKSVIAKDKETDRSRGFGFVTMSAPQEADAAISSLGGAE
ncbi:hypothetical protein BDV33DRAFT_208679 [Aspergillus novoparasiticus]|uniref:RRM domain-containing protein n=1 Tax=Aspergillus novoparasiticus TaxID=986946 RepID=A0A5N6EDH6_9EURO|nr:hypothetical protein BDV33DRAFT_208679 [Aspergillus novoparasiticus]